MFHLTESQALNLASQYGELGKSNLIVVKKYEAGEGDQSYIRSIERPPLIGRGKERRYITSPK